MSQRQEKSVYFYFYLTPSFVIFHEIFFCDLCGSTLFFSQCLRIFLDVFLNDFIVAAVDFIVL